MRFIIPALVFFVVYWPIVWLLLLVGHAAAWKADSKNWWEKLLPKIIKILIPLNEQGLLLNCLMWRFVVFVISACWRWIKREKA